MKNLHNWLLLVIAFALIYIAYLLAGIKEYTERHSRELTNGTNTTQYVQMEKIKDGIYNIENGISDIIDKL